MGKESSYNKNMQSNIPHKDIKSIEMYLYAAISILILSVTLLIFMQTILAGALIIVTISLGIIIVIKNRALNKKYKSLITSMLRSYDKKIKIISEFSHKIREPLNNLIITEDLLIETDLTAKQKEFAETIKASAISMVSVANELTMAVAENLNFESRKEIQFNIGSTIEHVIELYNARYKKNLDIKFIKGDDNIECIGDPAIIKQIFIGIFGRIEKQSCDHQITIKVSLNPVTESASENIITIIIEADIKMLLIDEADLDGSLPANLIDLMQGKYVQEIGDNSVMITMLFRIKKATQAVKEKKSSSKIDELMNKGKKQKKLKDLQVLLVEDNMINSRIVLLSLKPLVKSIDLANDGKEALEKFATNTYDLILMDIEMPVMDGLMATEKIRTLELTTNRRVPIIALTANAMIDDKEKCLSAGADDYISKPFQPLHLVEKINQLI